MDQRTPSPIHLREVIEADLPIFFEQQLDPVATQMAAFPSRRDRQVFMAHWLKIMGEATGITRTILFDGQVAGNIVSWAQSDQREVGYWIGREYWGKGIATAALAAFLQHVKMRPLYAHVAKHNRGSLRVLEKCGFVIIGEENDDLDESGAQVEAYVLKLSAANHDTIPAFDDGR
jgi:RimJ/RimL family protein N-acetyltransferase